MALWLYRGLVVPLGLLFLPLLALINPKIRLGLKMRRQKRVMPKFSVRPVWIHAASGEFEYAKPVIRELKARHPGIPIVVTYFSPTFARAVENFPGVDFCLPLPLDLPRPTRGFLKALNPRLGLIARTDFWPELLHQAKKLEIPLEVISYTQKSGAWAWMTRLRLQLIDQVHCVSVEDLDGLLRAGVTGACDVLGDTRYDQVQFRLDNPKPLPESLQQNKFTFTAGSTWAKDEAVLLPALLPFLRDGKMHLRLVPHEPSPDALKKLVKWLEENNLSYTRFSEVNRGQPFNNASVLLVDEVGYLAELYEGTQMAYVGGGFGRGVHSVMEALGAGAVTLVGPNHKNNREAQEFAELKVAEQLPLIEISLSAEVTAAVNNVLDADQTKINQAIQTEFRSRLGATRLVVDRLEKSGLFANS